MAIEIKAYKHIREKKLSGLEKSGQKAVALLSKDIKLFGNRISDKTKEQFYSQLYLLLSAGVDMKTALELFEQASKKKLDKQVFGDLQEMVLSGSSLSSAMGAQKHFTEYERYGVMIGEESGKLNEVLNEQALFFAKKIKQQRQFINALTYPAMVFVIAIGAVFFMMKFIVPMFSDVFKRFGGDLPYLTKIIVRISEAFSDYGYAVILAIIVVVLLLRSQRKQEWFRKFGSLILLKIPVVNKLVLKIYLTRFCQAMSLLLSSKTPLVNAISLARNMIGFYPIERSLDEVKEGILKGESLYKTLSRFPIYNSPMLALIKAAEEVNKVDVIFGKLAKQYSDDVEQQSALFGSLMEPIIIVFLGLLVAVILIAMYLPLFQLSTTVH